MKTNLKRPEMMLLATGLLLVAAIQVVARKVAVPDFLHGSVIGAGIGLELWALIKMEETKAGDIAYDAILVVK